MKAVQCPDDLKLTFTHEEAFALLYLTLRYPDELDETQERAIMRLAHYCRMGPDPAVVRPRPRSTPTARAMA